MTAELLSFAALRPVIEEIRARRLPVPIPAKQTPPPQALIKVAEQLAKADFIRMVGEILTDRIASTQEPLPRDVGIVLDLIYHTAKGVEPPGAG